MFERLHVVIISFNFLLYLVSIVYSLQLTVGKFSYSVLTNTHTPPLFCGTQPVYKITIYCDEYLSFSFSHYLIECLNTAIFFNTRLHVTGWSHIYLRNSFPIFVLENNSPADLSVFLSWAVCSPELYDYNIYVQVAWNILNEIFI